MTEKNINGSFAIAPYKGNRPGATASIRETSRRVAASKEIKTETDPMEGDY